MLVINAFSGNMLDGLKCEVKFEQVINVRKLVKNEKLTSAVGHESTASLFSSLLNKSIEMNRRNVTIKKGVVYLLGQYSGPRLEEGATELPETASIEWWTVEKMG